MTQKYEKMKGAMECIKNIRKDLHCLICKFIKERFYNTFKRVEFCFQFLYN